MLNAEIGETRAVQIGGVPQWIYIKGRNRKNPMILFLHGGPGLCESQFAHLYGPQLEEEFTVIHWDQRGANRSFSKAVSVESMTFDSFFNDATELIGYLLGEFGQQKLNLIGHSWGSGLGLSLASKHPEMVNYYIGIGQLIDALENEKLAYDFILSEAKKKSDRNTVEDIEGLGRPPLDQTGCIFLTVYITMFGGNYFDPSRSEKIADVIKGAPENYKSVATFREMSRISDDCHWRSLQQFNLLKEVNEISVPCTFLHGRNDFMTALSPVEEFVKNPIFKAKKELIVFEKSSHWPHHEQTEKFVEIVKSRLGKQ